MTFAIAACGTFRILIGIWVLSKSLTMIYPFTVYKLCSTSLIGTIVLTLFDE
jgi:hypothetical protein